MPWRGPGPPAAARALPDRRAGRAPTVVALLGLREGWGQEYVRGAYRLWFEQGKPPGEAPALPAALEALGLDAAAVMARAEAPEIAQALRRRPMRQRRPRSRRRWRRRPMRQRRRNCSACRAFTVGSELFWGDDRLEDALAWAREGRLPPV